MSWRRLPCVTKWPSGVQSWHLTYRVCWYRGMGPKPCGEQRADPQVPKEAAPRAIRGDAGSLSQHLLSVYGLSSAQCVAGVHGAAMQLWKNKHVDPTTLVTKREAKTPAPRPTDGTTPPGLAMSAQSSLAILWFCTCKFTCRPR